MKKIFTTALIFVAGTILSTAQNVGIGNSNPVERLHVSGNVKADTIKPNAIKLTPNAGQGKVLTSDASGNASWQSLSVNSGGDVGFGSWGDCGMNSLSGYQPTVDPTAEAYDYLGGAVAIYGNYAVVGRHNADVGFYDAQGMANVYEFNGTNWVLKQVLYDPSGNDGDGFGVSVSISANYIAIGADGNNNNQGAVFIYKLTGGNWNFLQKLTDVAGEQGDYYGFSVSITEGYLAVGSPFDNVFSATSRGSICMYRNTGSFYSFQQKVLDPSGAANENFGWSVSLFSDRLAVGSPGDNVDANNQFQEGSACIFQYNGSGWAFQQKLENDPGASSEDAKFGACISLWEDYVLIGVPQHDISATQEKRGAALLYHYGANGWEQIKQFYDPVGQPGDEFGSDVHLSGEYAIIGAALDRVNGQPQRGSSTIYRRVGLGWGSVQFITDKMGSDYDLFGRATAIDGNTRRFVIGAPGYAQNAGKIVFGKIF